MKKTLATIALFLTACGNPPSEDLCEARMHALKKEYGDPIKTLHEDDCQSFKIEDAPEKPIAWCKILEYEKFRVFVFPSAENKCCSVGEGNET